MKKIILSATMISALILLSACNSDNESPNNEPIPDYDSGAISENNEYPFEYFLGTWQSNINDTTFSTFLADGTGYRGSTMTTRRINWEQDGAELLVTNFQGNVLEYLIRIEDAGQTLILTRQSTGSEFSYARVANPDDVVAQQRAFLDSPHHMDNIDLDEVAQMNQLEMMLLTGAMATFETEHAVSDEQARYLAFSPFLLMVNFESPHVFEINCLWRGTACAADILSNFWNITDEEAALRSLESLSSATGQTQIANDIWQTLIQNGQIANLDPDVGFNLAGLEHLVAVASPQVTEVLAPILADDEIVAEFAMLMAEDGITGTVEDFLYETLVMFRVADRVNTGLQAFEVASQMLIDEFDFTRDELLAIETLAAWDFGRVSIIARYGVAAGFIDEATAWEHLQLAANNATQYYHNWREYAAAHILGRAIAFGNDSRDMVEVLDFLFNHETSPFQRHEFRAD